MAQQKSFSKCWHPMLPLAQHNAAQHVCCPVPRVSPFTYRDTASTRYGIGHPQFVLWFMEVRAEPLGEPGSSLRLKDYSDGLHCISNLHTANNSCVFAHSSAVRAGPCAWHSPPRKGRFLAYPRFQMPSVEQPSSTAWQTRLPNTQYCNYKARGTIHLKTQEVKERKVAAGLCVVKASSAWRSWTQR